MFRNSKRKRIYSSKCTPAQGPLGIRVPSRRMMVTVTSIVIPWRSVGGDALFVKFKANTNTLITSSAASKFYSCEADLPKQHISQEPNGEQRVFVRVGSHENIFFEGSKTQLHNKIMMSNESRFWLGDNGFENLNRIKRHLGTLRSATTITKNGRLIHRIFWTVQRWIDAWGLNRHRVIGSLIATSAYIEDEEFARLFSDIKKKLGSSSFETQEKGLFLLRYLGFARSRNVNGFNAARDALHQVKRSCSVVWSSPRIWNY